MLGTFKRWIGGRREGPDGRVIIAWAKERGFPCKRVREGEGYVVEGHMHGQAWRLEWGDPQRAYLLDRELRLRMDLKLPQAMQMLVTSRSLAEELEQAAYALFTQGMQTTIDSGMPEEMRWLAMFPKISLPSMKSLRQRYVAVAAAPEPLQYWLDGELGERLREASDVWLPADVPFVLMTLRGRLYLRLESLAPQADLLDGVVVLFEAAARRSLAAMDAVGSSQGWPSTGSTAWQSAIPSELPDGETR
jgi:hypothetical protein